MHGLFIVMNTFGADLDDFKLERWLGLSEDALSDMKRHIFSVSNGRDNP